MGGKIWIERKPSMLNKNKENTKKNKRKKYIILIKSFFSSVKFNKKTDIKGKRPSQKHLEWDLFTTAVSFTVGNI